jgi:hypothetical protein
MRLFYLMTFVIASTSALAPLANARRSHSIMTPFKAAKASPVKAADKAVPPGKKQPTKVSPPMKGVPPSKTSPMKGTPPGKTSPAKGGKPKASLFTAARVNKKGVDVKEIRPAAKKLFGIF